MKRFAKNVLSVILAALLCAALGTLFVACGEDEADPVPDQPVKVKDGIDFELACGTDREFAVADYITAYGNAVTAQSGDGQKVTATLEDGTLTIAAVSEGEATVTLACGEVNVTFTVTVYRTYTVTVDGEPTQVRGGSEFTLPAAKQPADGNFEFVAWQVGGEQKQPGEKVTVTGDLTITSVTARKAPVKVKDGETFELAYNASRPFKVADYITAYGNAVTAQSDAAGIASAAVENGTLTITAVSEGETTVTLACVGVSVTFTVTVYRTYTVTVDEEPTQVRGGSEFTLPAAKQPADGNFEFVAWQVGGEQKQPGEKVTVTGDLTITSVTQRKAPVKVKDGEAIEIAFGGSERRNVADYITTYGNTVSVSSKEAGTATAEVVDGVLTIAAVSSGETTVKLTCGSVEVSFSVTVSQPDVKAPEFEDGDISFDLFEKGSGSLTFVPTAPEGVSYTYAYSLAEQDGNAQISDGALTYTATEPVSKVLTVNVTATATVSGETIEKQGSFTVTITVTDTTPAVIESAIAADGTVDLYDHADGYTIDLTANIENAGNVTSYTVAVGDEEAAPVENAEEYVFTGSYSDTAQQVTLTVTALFGEKSVSYTYTVWVIDSTAYRLYNGGFDLGLVGWTLEGMLNGERNDAALGGISEATGYWPNDPSGTDPLFYNDGKFFSAYADSAQEVATGTLTSSVFTLGGSGWITYKLGGAKNIEQVYMQVLSEDGSKAVTLPNFAWSDVAGQKVRGCSLVAYKVDLREYGFELGDRVYIRVTDNENMEKRYGLFFLDSVNTYYTEEPTEDYELVSRYRFYNGGFETGNLTGWTLEGDIGAVTDQDTYWQNTGLTPAAYDKEGNFLFSWWNWDEDANEGAGAEVNREGNTGTLQSSTFLLKKGAVVSFRFGGGGGNENIYLEFVKKDGTPLAKFYNTQAAGGKLIAYTYTFAELDADTECYVRVTDNATSGWGCFTLDDVQVNLASAPTGFAAAVNQLANG